MTASTETGRIPTRQPLIVRIFHWLNIISLFGMISSGLQIYNANPVFGGRAGIQIPWLFTMGGYIGKAILTKSIKNSTITTIATGRR